MRDYVIILLQCMYAVLRLRGPLPGTIALCWCTGRLRTLSQASSIMYLQQLREVDVEY